MLNYRGQKNVRKHSFDILTLCGLEYVLFYSYSFLSPCHFLFTFRDMDTNASGQHPHSQVHPTVPPVIL